MKKDTMTLRKGIEKMEKLGEKKFTKKETKADLKEGFDLKKFLVENSLTTNSRNTNTEKVEYEGYMIQPSTYNYYNDPRHAYEFYNLNDNEESLGYGRSIEDCKDQIDAILS
jgi:hypothetical protein